MPLRSSCFYLRLVNVLLVKVTFLFLCGGQRYDLVLRTFDHVAGVLRPPFGVVVVWVSGLWLLQLLEDVGPYEAQTSRLRCGVHRYQSVFNLGVEEGVID